MHKLVYDHIVVRYGELSTKGKNRKDFVRCLTNNIRKRLEHFGALSYTALHDGLYIKLNGEDYEAIKACLKQVFGYAYFSGAIIVEKDLEKVKETALTLIDEHHCTTFKCSSKRTDKSFPLRSDAINREVAGHILRNRKEVRVDVHQPELTIYIVVNDKEILVMDEKVRGIGGYPTGVNGRALVMMSGGIDSPVAAYLTMKRGLKVECIHFASMPYTSKQALDKVLQLAKIVSVYQNDVIVHVVPFTDLQLAIYQNASESYAITLMRRMMYRIADRIAQKRKLLCISNGESLGQVASQTPESMTVISEVSKTLILRPLCMMDKLEIIDIAKAIGTYETSILPYEDCCTIFDPKNPVTKPKQKECLFYETKFDYEKLVQECVDKTEIIKVSYRDSEQEEDLF